MLVGYSFGAVVTLDSGSGMIYSEQTRGSKEAAGIGVRIAVYSEDGGPEITEVSAANPRSATAKFSRFVMDTVKGLGGRVPEAAVREILENLVHAGYEGVIISVLENGSGVRVSDKGPGIEDKSRAIEFGFSGATPEVARQIRGVGAGLGIARAAAAKVGGTLTIENNIGGGTVVTVSLSGGSGGGSNESVPQEEPAQRRYPDAVPRMNISERQQKALVTVLECGEVGPSTVADRLEISVSTAYRDLSVLEEHGLVVTGESGKRLISRLGRDLVEAIVNTWVK